MSDWWSPALWEAARRGDHAEVLRRAREERDWSQGRLGKEYGCSASTISRFENGRRGLRDVAVLRRFAIVLGLPAEAFGLTGGATERSASPPTTPRTSRPSTGPPRKGPDSVRRRAFLIAAGLAASTAVTEPDALASKHVGVDPTALLTRTLEGVLLGAAGPAVAPASTQALSSALRSATTDIRNCRYVDLAARLPDLIATAEATHLQISDPNTAGMVAQAYGLATRALFKLDASGLEWLAADRALRAADSADDPLLLAEAQRTLGAVCRRAGQHDRAQTLIISAADQLHAAGNEHDPRHLLMRGSLMCSASYSAARSGDHDRAKDLLADADATALRLDGHKTEHESLTANVLSYRVSADYLLGNAGAGLRHARGAQLGQFPDTERRARFLVDVALCFAQWDKPGRAYQALLTAERTAPEEVRTRATARRLVAELLQHPRRAHLYGLTELAARTNPLI